MSADRKLSWGDPGFSHPGQQHSEACYEGGRLTCASADRKPTIGDAILNQVADQMLTRSAAWFPKAHRTHSDLIVHLGMGVGGEGGEVCDAVKKLHRDDDYNDTTRVEDELCDALTYVLMLGRTLGINWTAALSAMVDKCEGRWGGVPVEVNLDPDTPFDPETDRLVVLRPGEYVVRSHGGPLPSKGVA